MSEAAKPSSQPADYNPRVHWLFPVMLPEGEMPEAPLTHGEARQRLTWLCGLKANAMREGEAR